MINGKRVIAIIPARGGSKGLPGKNIKELCGKPLIAWSIEAGLASQYIDEVMVTTDSEEVAGIARDFGAIVPFIRPAELASDTATSFDTVKHAIDFYQNELNETFDYIVLLEPTSPLRESGDIDGMIEIIISVEDKFDAIVSLGEAHLHPSIMKKTDGSKIEPFCKELIMVTRRQDNAIAYFPYGVAYIVKTKTFFEERSFYPCRTTHKIIKRYQCYEIDDIYDFLAIENIMKHEWSLE
ncbi:acylneuraminate cytidylyltransferase family protein [Rhodoferax ferrireducens]|uniref:acylneuraminate cytidylyltransferase family protein n=1 Tax=Rhodoferax ferrireducens TaxID=192843 RepID=UPI00298E474E|nr:acylneuraminate cytidylyltransferase family protein [Rhodoferax ferrireducens]WPC68113.1 acylneuraminate cytidylyltransferase family protein [Rhodoferax ferrireducens]